MKRSTALTKDFLSAMKQSVDVSCKKSLDKAVELSNGGYSLAQLEAMDHPYARRHGMPLLPPEIINKQTGNFQRAWKKENASVSGSKVKAKITNYDRKADYLTQPRGWPSTKMFQRPVDKEVETFWEDTLKKQIEDRIKQIEQTDYIV